MVRLWLRRGASSGPDGSLNARQSYCHTVSTLGVAGSLPSASQGPLWGFHEFNGLPRGEHVIEPIWCLSAFSSCPLFWTAFSGGTVHASTPGPVEHSSFPYGTQVEERSPEPPSPDAPSPAPRSGGTRARSRRHADFDQAGSPARTMKLHTGMAGASPGEPAWVHAQTERQSWPVCSCFSRRME
jgi:hypothetical protein